MKYFKVCVTCGKDYDIEANPQTEQEWKNIQSQVGKKGGLCTNCTSTNYYDDGSMDLKEIAKKYNAVFSIAQDGSIEIQSRQKFCVISVTGRKKNCTSFYTGDPNYSEIFGPFKYIEDAVTEAQKRLDLKEKGSG